MISSSLAGVALPLLAAPTEDVAMPSEAGEPFGSILEEVTGETHQAVEAEDAKTEKDVPTQPTFVAYFCPPPVVAVLQTIPAKLEPIDLPEKSSQVPDGAPLQSEARTNGDTSAPLAASGGAQKIDLKVLQPVPPMEVTLSPLESSAANPPETEAPPLANASHGTLVAQLEKRVRNSDKTAEIAPQIEQKMPVREFLRRTRIDVSCLEAFKSEQQPTHLLEPDFEVSPLEIIPVKSMDAAALVETIRTEVTALRQRGEAAMTVVLRPDAATQLSLDVSIGSDGTVHAQVRFERGDFQALNAQWTHLQQSLATHGIRIADLSNQNNAGQSHQHSSADQFSNFSSGQDPRHRDEREVLDFEEQFNASRVKFPSKQQLAIASVAYSPRYWQSWA